MHEHMIWHLFPRRYLATQVRMVVLVSCVAAALSFAALVAVARMLDDEDMGLPVVLSFSVVSATIAAAFACMVATVRIARCARKRVDGRFPHRTEITDVVIRGRHDALSSDDRVLSVKYAVALLPYLAFQQAQMVLLCAGLLLTQFRPGSGWPGGGNPIGLLGAAMVLLATIASVVLWIVQSRRVRTFLDENQHLLGAPVR